MASKQSMAALKKFAETHNSWVLLRDDLGKKPVMLFKYKPGSWKITNDQIGLGDPEAPMPPHLFWLFNDIAQWEVANESERTLHITGPVKWCIQSFETEEEADAKIKQLKEM